MANRRTSVFEFGILTMLQQERQQCGHKISCLVIQIKRGINLFLL